jgi:uncharacterized RDD family membrane protein YckC
VNGHTNTSLQRQITVRTPENLEIQYSLAGAGTRAAAYMLDLMVMMLLIQIGINLIMAIVFALPIADSRWGAALGGMITFAAYNGYFMIFEWVMNGQTPGKRVLGIRVVKQGGYALSILDTLLRNLMRFVDFLPMFYGVGLVSLLATSRSQRLGDLVAGTLVVHQHEIETDSLVPEIPVVEASQATLPADQVAAVPSELLELCVDFFRVLPNLAGRHRQEIAGELVDVVRHTSGLVPLRTQSAEAFLATVIQQSGQIAPWSSPSSEQGLPPS